MEARGTGTDAVTKRSDVMLQLRTATAPEHQQVEDTLALLDPDLTPARLTDVLRRMHAFWTAVEAGLDAWATAEPADAGAVDWAGRRRAGVFAGDLATLGARPLDAGPDLPAPAGTDGALGTLYVLEGSTLGGVFIDRHLATLPALADVRLRAFSPYGERTGAMWAGLRRATRDHVAGGGDPDAVVDGARRTFRALAQWCAGVEQSAPSQGPVPPSSPGGAPA